MDGQPTFSSEVFAALKMKCAQSDSQGHPTLCSLTVDEMSIRQQVQWNRGSFEGYVDIGTGLDSDFLLQAKATFAIMAVAINGRWKLGYFFVDGLVGEQQANLVQQSLLCAHDAGAIIVSLTM